MLFNSFHFVFFFSIVFAVAMAIRRKVVGRNIFLLFASYYFYGCWDPRFLILIVVSTMIDYCAGFGVAGERLSWKRRFGVSAGFMLAALICIGPDWKMLMDGRGLVPSGATLELSLCAGLAVLWPLLFELLFAAPAKLRARLFLVASLLSNLGILGYFKYYDFFVGSFVDLSKSIGWSPNVKMLSVVLPVGISFFTFQTLSYTIDLYRKRIGLERNLLNFALFVGFFPQLVAGPIERASHLLPQMRRVLDVGWWHIHTGVYLICWGLFKKVVIADNVAKVVERAFDPEAADKLASSGGSAYLGVLAFAIQIYCDFSAYTDIARGVARMMGFDLMINFNLPYFATNPSDFWRRWHISLSTWLRDYLYIPLGGNKTTPRWNWMHLLLPVLLVSWLAGWPWWIGAVVSAVYLGYLIVHRGIYNNLMMTMLLGGLWHGAAWTFVLWGLYHGMLLVLHRLLEPVIARIINPDRQGYLGAALWKAMCIVFFFQLTLFGWLLFKADSLEQVRVMSVAIFTNFTVDYDVLGERSVLIVWSCFFTLLIVQLVQFLSKDQMVVFRLPWWLRGIVYFLFLLGFILFGEFGETPFLYFQF